MRPAVRALRPTALPNEGTLLRDVFACERTLLAYVRTATAASAVGVALSTQHAARWACVAFVGAGLALNVYAVSAHYVVLAHATRARFARDPCGHWFVMLTAIALAAIAFALIFSM